MKTRKAAEIIDLTSDAEDSETSRTLSTNLQSPHKLKRKSRKSIIESSDEVSGSSSSESSASGSPIRKRIRSRNGRKRLDCFEDESQSGDNEDTIKSSSSNPRRIRSRKIRKRLEYSTEEEDLQSLPSDFEEKIIPVHNTTDDEEEEEGFDDSDSEESPQSDQSYSSDDEIEKDAIIKKLFCSLCFKYRPADSFSSVEAKKAAQSEDGGRCLIHHYSDQRLAEPALSPSDHSSNSHDDDDLLVDTVAIRKELEDSDHDHNSNVEFGKYRGETFRSVFRNHPDYCRWVMLQEDPSDDLANFQRWLSRVDLVGDDSDFSD